MAIPGYCANCGKYALGLFKCHVCGARVCPECVVPGTTFCKICKGEKID